MTRNGPPFLLFHIGASGNGLASLFPQSVPRSVIQHFIFKLMDCKATWNACLGISNKIDLIINMINENKIDILCLQEVEIDQKIITNMFFIKKLKY